MSWGRESKYSSDRGTAISAAEEGCWAQHLFSWKTAVTKNSMTIITTAFPDIKFCSIRPFPPYACKPKDRIKTWAHSLLKLCKRCRWSINKQICLGDKCERALLSLWCCMSGAAWAVLPSPNGCYKTFIAHRGAASCTMAWWQLILFFSCILFLKSEVSLVRLCLGKTIIVTDRLLSIEEGWGEVYAGIYATALILLLFKIFWNLCS